VGYNDNIGITDIGSILVDRVGYRHLDRVLGSLISILSIGNIGLIWG
jgi:hypothetical protein